MKHAISSFSVSTAAGPGNIGVRALMHLSGAGLYALAARFERCECLLVWPNERPWHEMVRLAKPNGGCRLITRMDDMIRIWSRVKVAVSRCW
eukprot:2522122-Pyramimonas_sp.AAC.1